LSFHHYTFMVEKQIFMKPILTFLIIAFFVAGCKRTIETTQHNNGYLEQIMACLEDSVDAAVYDNLNFTGTILSQSESADLHIVNIPFKNKNLHEFVLLQTDNSGTILQGRLITLSREKAEPGSGYNGKIVIQSLAKRVLVSSDIRNGYIIDLPKQGIRNPGLQASQPDQTKTSPSPDIVDIGTIQPNGSISYSEWIKLVSMYYWGNLDGNYYSPSGAGNYNGDGGSGSPSEVPLILVGYETQISNPAIDIKTFIDCFSSIPDEGATCSIEIFADIPVDNDPNKLFDWETESPGHTFLQIKKSNGSRSIMQNIGFYPKTNWKSMLTPAPVDGKFVDNGGHEFNASFKINISPAKLQSALTQIAYLARFVKYDIDEYNCTNFALEVFNSVRHFDNKLVIPRYDIPGGMAPGGTCTPQGLYNELKRRKQSGNAEANNIVIPGYKGWVAKSNGPCN
jgi:hypothetical protein